MAGFLDGEGCFTWKSGQKTYHGGPRLDCSHTYPPILFMLQRRFGGGISAEKRRKPQHRRSWKWYVTGTNARNAMRSLYPHLKEKRPQVYLLLLAWETTPVDRVPILQEIVALKRIDYTGDEEK